MSGGRRGGARAALAALGYHGLALSVAAVFVVPAAWVIAGSLRQPGLPPPRTIEWVPAPVAWDNYVRIFELVPLGRYLLNSLVVVALAVPLTVVVASWAGFAMAQLPARARHALIGLAVALRMVPLTALWLTRFVMFAELRLVDTLAALVAPAWMGSSPFFVLIFYWAFRRMPPALVDAARLDGLGAFGVWARIAMPLARPATVAVGVLTFVQYWSDFINPLLYLKTDARYTLSVGLRALQQMDATNWPLHLAAAVVMMGPVVLLFFLAQRAFWMPDRAAGGGGR